MNITKAHLIFFSPTHTSRKVGEGIVHGLGLKEVAVTDVTHEAADLPEMPADVLAVVVVPVYVGHIPHLAAVRMAGLRASGTPAVAVVVYGNRAYENALQELDTFLTGKGFRVIAAATFVGEHSYSTVRHPIAAGRPDKEDREEAVLLGHRVMAKVQAARSADALQKVDVSRIRRPKQPFWAKLRFIWQVIRLRKSGQPMPVVPRVDEALCTHCGRCAAICPNRAIAKGDECHTSAERCIRCCACVKGCPQQARSFDTPFAVLLSRHFKYRKENEMLL